MSLAFCTPLLLRATATSQKTTCNLSCKRVSPRAMAESWEKQAEWNAAGSGVQAKGLQTIEYIIRQDGTVVQKVVGVRGKDCVKITEKIEQALGNVVHSEKTEEYFQENFDVVQNENYVQEQVVQPGDALYVDDSSISSW